MNVHEREWRKAKKRTKAGMSELVGKWHSLILKGRIAHERPSDGLTPAHLSSGSHERATVLQVRARM
jgi:hypothetical protein